MKRIVTIFTGGTIGSKKTASGDISPDSGMAYRLLEMYREKQIPEYTGESLPDTERVEFITEEPYYILSENLSGTELTLLGRCVKKHLSEKGREADGVIILHGTDTLAYTAAFLGLLFDHARIPVLLVSSDYPLEEERANGFRNFFYAVEFIKGQFGTGVFVSYANEGETVKIHRGTRLLRHMEYSADVFSSFRGFYGSFTEDGKFLKNPVYKEEIFTEEIFTEEMLPQEKYSFSGECDDGRQEEIFLTESCPEVLFIFPYVGMVYPEIPERVRAVLMGSYHSGTIRISGGLKKFMEEAEKRGIPVYLTGLNKEDADYETVKEYKELGILPLRNRTAITEYMRLWMHFSRS